MPDIKALEEEIAEIQNRIEKLRVLYQQYFMGMERTPPLVQQEQIERLIRHSALNKVRTPVLKFKFNNAVQKYRTLQVYWNRMMRDIEEGRLLRQVRRDGTAARLPTRRRKDPVRAQGGDTRKADTRDTGALYDEYIQARKSQGLPVDGITRDAFERSLERQRRINRERLNADDVAFSVAVKDGKVVLQARPVMFNGTMAPAGQSDETPADAGPPGSPSSGTPGDDPGS